MKQEIEELTDEIRKLRKEVRELRDSRGSTHIHHHYSPLPVHVPQWAWPQPYYGPSWSSGTVIWGNGGAASPTFTSGVGFENLTSLPSGAEIDIGSAL